MLRLLGVYLHPLSVNWNGRTHPPRLVHWVVGSVPCTSQVQARELPSTLFPEGEVYWSELRFGGSNPPPSDVCDLLYRTTERSSLESLIGNDIESLRGRRVVDRVGIIGPFLPDATNIDMI